MNNKTYKPNVAEFNRDVRIGGGYQYTTNAPYSSVVANRRMTKAIVALIPKRAQTLIDIGCGDGTYTGELAAHFPDVEVLGVDPAAEAIARARFLFPAALFVIGDLLAPATLPRQPFDVGIIRGVIHHLPDGPLGLVNAARMCKTLIVIEPNGNNPILKLIEKHSSYHIEHEEQSFSSRELEAWCRSAGYTEITTDYIGFVPMFFPTVLAKIIHFLQPLFELMYPVKKYFAAQIVLSCNRLKDENTVDSSSKENHDLQNYGGI
ncbi:MAG: class I SAM-dependent methyltransferase [Pseudomonadota bacterium]